MTEGLSVIFPGRCEDLLPQLPANSVHAVVTDPPYELGFMGKGWDNSGVAFNTAVWKECLRILKPGGHLLAFGGTRTYHRIACAIEDAGFEIRDCMMWLYGSGFPKSLDISKAIDKAAGAEREVIGTRKSAYGSKPADDEAKSRADGKGGAGLWTGGESKDVPLTGGPATDAAKQWSGWGTALKPAWEPIIVAMKPLDGTFAENAQKWGVAGLNVDGCRVAIDAEEVAIVNARSGAGQAPDGWGHKGNYEEGRRFQAHKGGRFPANLILDEQAGAALDWQKPVTSTTGKRSDRSKKAKVGNTQFLSDNHESTEYPGDSGGASRFFYCAKASAQDRFFWCRTCKAVAGQKDAEAHEKHDRNAHPTVKPVELMRYLVRLVCPPGGVVLDPFAGSGTTLAAAKGLGFQAIGMEQDPEYAKICEYRIR